MTRPKRCTSIFYRTIWILKEWLLAVLPEADKEELEDEEELES